MARKKQPETVRARVFRIMQNAGPGDDSSRLFDYILTVFIVINTLTVMLETVPDIRTQYGPLLLQIDIAFALIFSVEYVIRLWAVTARKKYAHPIIGRLRFALTPTMLIDLLAIVPFFTPFFFALNLNTLRALRLLRLIRILKIYRYSDALQAFTRVIRLKKRQLGASLLVLAIGLVFSATVIYYAENQAQPEHFGSIPASLWWSTITLSTVGYGDIIPVTPIGRLVGAFVALLGIGIFAIPAGILASGYMRVSQELSKRRETAKPRKRKKR